MFTTRRRSVAPLPAPSAPASLVHDSPRWAERLLTSSMSKNAGPLDVEEIPGGNKKVTYQGRKYTVREGKRGGLYIMVGKGDKQKKVYLRK